MIVRLSMRWWPTTLTLTCALFAACGGLDDNQVNIIDGTAGTGGQGSGGKGATGGSGATNGDAGATGTAGSGSPGGSENGGAGDSGPGGSGNAGAENSIGGSVNEGGGGAGGSVDVCPAVPALVAGALVEGSTSLSENQVAAHDCGGTLAGSASDQIYSFTLASEADVAITLQSQDFDGVIRVSSACDVGKTLFRGCATDTDGQVDLDLPDLAAGTYYIAVDGVAGNDFGDFAIELNTTNPDCLLSELKIERVDSGVRERTLLFNRNGCSLDLSWFGVYHQDAASDGVLTELPAIDIGPHETVWLAEDAVGDEIDVGGQIGYSADSGGAVYLCRGPCTPPAGDNVLDAFYFPGNTDYSLLEGIDFQDGATGITNNDDEGKDYYRLHYDGVAPNFVPSADFIPAYFVEKFETASPLANWTAEADAGSLTPTFESPPGTVDSLALALSGGISPTYEGYTYTFPTAITPTSMRWRVRVSTTTEAAGYVWATNSTDSYGVVGVYFDNAPTINFISTDITSYSANTWYDVEATNIDFTSNTLDISVNGTSYGQRTFFDVDDIGIIHLYNFTGGKAWWDQIIVQ